MFRNDCISAANEENVNTGEETPFYVEIVCRLAAMVGQPQEARPSEYVQEQYQLRERIEGGDSPALVTG